jgi:hypothetical protein
MVGLICIILGLLVAVAVWVEGIDSMHKNYTDYKGEDFLNEEEDLKDWDITLTDGLEEEIIPIYKFNNGRGAMLCNKCRTIISTGPKTEELYCEKCKTK